MTVYTKVTDETTTYTETADSSNRYVPTGLLLHITTEDDRRIQAEDLDYLIIENRLDDITEVDDQSTSYTEVGDVSTSYTEVGDV